MCFSKKVFDLLVLMQGPLGMEMRLTRELWKKSKFLLSLEAKV